MSDNELIAEFMGITVAFHGPVLYHADEDGFIDFKEGAEPYWPDKYWNELMPVVEKIHKSNPEAFKIDLFTGPRSPLAKLYIHTSISEVYKAVVEFIKWFNTQTK